MKAAPPKTTILRVETDNVAVLESVDPECFDAPVDMSRAARCVASPDVVLVVAVADGIVVGQCLAMLHRHPDKATEMYVDDLAVSLSFRRQGVASRLVGTCIEYGAAAGAEEIWVAVDEDNDAAAHFYRSIGLERRSAWVFERECARRSC